jgi:hypothetical protein
MKKGIVFFPMYSFRNWSCGCCLSTSISL